MPTSVGRSEWHDNRAGAMFETTAAIDTSGEEDSENMAVRQRLLGMEFPGVRRYERGEPSFSRYPMAKFMMPVIHGTPRETSQLGFDARAIGGQNMTDDYLYIDAIRLVVPPRLTFAWNLPTATQGFAVEWRTGPFGGAVTPVPGEFAIVYLWDEWVPPAWVQVA